MPTTKPSPFSIASSLVTPVTVPIHVPFTISRESLACAEIVVIEITNSAGAVGLGECAPFPSLTYDDVATAHRVASHVLADLHGRSTSDALSHLAEVREAVVRDSVTAYVGVESALWDLRAQELGLPLAALFGSSSQKVLETDITLPIMAPELVDDFWGIFAPYEFRTIKVKVSGNVGQDSAMIAALYALVPRHTRYILDGNQGFTVGSAVRLLTEMSKLGLGIELFEQPLPELDMVGLEQLSKQVSVPICVDETVRTAAQLKEILGLGLRPVVNIKIMKSGIVEALKIIALASSSGCPLMIGGMLESEIAMGCSLHIACGTGAFRYADLDTPFFFKRHITASSPWHKHHSRLVLPVGYGLAMALSNRHT